jgi:hypothetical protein
MTKQIEGLQFRPPGHKVRPYLKNNQHAFGSCNPAHACNPSYSGGIDQEDRGSKPAGQVVCKNLSQQKPIKKKGLAAWLKEKAMSSNPSATKKKKNSTKRASAVVKEVEHLPSKPKALSSTPSTA